MRVVNPVLRSIEPMRAAIHNILWLPGVSISVVIFILKCNLPNQQRQTLHNKRKYKFVRLLFVFWRDQRY